MNLRKRHVVFLVLLVFINCDFKGGQGSKEVITTINIKLRVLAEDRFQIFYAFHPLDTYEEKNSKYAIVCTNKNVQEVVFHLESFDNPAKIRIDLGSNRRNTEIDILEIKVRKNNQSIRIHQQDLPAYFKHSSSIISILEGQIKLDTLKVNFDPYIEASPRLIKELIEL